MYVVYAGSYTIEENAINQAMNLFKAGYDVICTKLNRYYRLQVGEFKNYNNAQNFKEELINKGFPAFVDMYDERKSNSWQLTYLTQN